MWRLLTGYLLLIFLSSAECYKILGIFPYPGKSHYDNFEPVLRELAARGHDLTVITHFPPKAPVKNFESVDVGGTYDASSGSVVDISQVPNLRIIKYITGPMLGVLSSESCDLLNHPNINKLLKSDKQFDLILIEQFNTDCFLALVHHYKVPFVGLASSIFMPWTNKRLGNIDNPSYIPNHFLDYSDRMNFIQRVENTFQYVIGGALDYFFIHQYGQYMANKVFGSDLPALTDIAKNISLILVNSHFTLTLPRPLVPGVIEISGMNIYDRKVKAVPQNLEKWISESPKGVIYFSMGSMIKGHTFPEEKRRAFLKAFARLDQRVLWKWENETMPEKPDNVMIQKWMPQFDILCHPNVKGFISHGGLLGTTETVHCGVPAVVMPQFGDQHTNARALEASGGGIVLDFHSITEDSVYNALKTILDPEFNKKAKELSARFRDRPMPPLETAIYWIEYVARHKGAHHLKTAAVGMPLYQYLLLDVAAFFIAVISLIFYIFYRLVKLCFRKKSKNNSKKTQ